MFRRLHKHHWGSPTVNKDRRSMLTLTTVDVTSKKRSERRRVISDDFPMLRTCKSCGQRQVSHMPTNSWHDVFDNTYGDTELI